MGDRPNQNSGMFSMGNIIRFPLSRDSNPLQPVLNKSNAPLEQEFSDAYVISPQEDEAFMDLILEWPCYEGFERTTSLTELFELYYDDELSLSQDCALEFMFHMHDPESTFDIGNALYTWDKEDREFFMLSINMHAELIDKVKQDEL